MPAKRVSLGFNCPECGRDYGVIKIKTINRERRTHKDIEVHRIKIDEFGNAVRKKCSSNRNSYTIKYDALFGDFDQDRKHVINLSSSDPLNKLHATIMRKMELVSIGLFLLVVILPFVALKYPNLGAKIRLLMPLIKMIEEYCRPMADGKYDRSTSEWVQIIEYSKSHGYNAASRKFPAITDGKEKYLSPNYIKQKAKTIDKFLNFAGSKKMKISMKYLAEVKRTVINDDELLRLSKRSFRQYYNSVIDKSNVYSYTYFYIQHYDPDFYKKQKSYLKKGLIKKKNSVTGKIECKLFKVPMTLDPSSIFMNITRDLVHFKKKLEDRKVKRHIKSIRDPY